MMKKRRGSHSSQKCWRRVVGIRKCWRRGVGVSENVRGAEDRKCWRRGVGVSENVREKEQKTEKVGGEEEWEHQKQIVRWAKQRIRWEGM